MLKRIGPSIEPWGTPKSIFCHVLYSLSIFTPCFLPTGCRESKLVLVNLKAISI